jgi:hypothetical protein
LKGLVYLAPGADAVTVKAVGEMDIYYPAGPGPHPVVLFVNGFNDVGFMRIVGCKFKEMVSYVEWSRNMAASGMAAVLYSNQDAVPDLHAILKQLQSEGAGLNLDMTRLGVYAASGSGTIGLSLLMKDAPARVAAIALNCPYTMDLDGHTEIQAAAAQFKTVPATHGKSIDDLAADIPMFIARAGRDETPGLNIALDRFVAQALARNLPLTLVNHPGAPHAFDIFHESETSRDVIKSLLVFLRSHLSDG